MFWIFQDFFNFLYFFQDLFQKFLGRFDTSRSMIRLSVREIIELNIRVVLDGACDDDYDDL